MCVNTYNYSYILQCEPCSAYTENYIVTNMWEEGIATKPQLYLQ